MLPRLYRYGQWPNSHDLLKFFAVLIMILDHIGAYLLPSQHWLRMIGRAAAPCFFFLIGQFTPKKPRWDLILYGVILTFLTYLNDQEIYLSILLNFFFIKWVLGTLEEKQQVMRKIEFKFVILFGAIANFVVAPYLEYGLSGLMIALAARRKAHNAPEGQSLLIASLVYHFFYEALSFIKIIQGNMAYLFCLVAFFTVTVLNFYKLRTWSVGLLNPFILFISRYSLDVYFWHLALLRTLLIV